MDLNHRCLGVGQESLPLDHGTVLSFRMCKAEAVGLEPTIPIHRDTCFRDRLLIRPDDFPAAMRFVLCRIAAEFCQRQRAQPLTSCGGWNRTSGLLIQSQASLPAATAPQCFHQGCVPFAKGSGRRIRTFIACFKGRWPTISRSPSVACCDQIDRRVPCGSWTRLSGLEDRCLCRSAKGTLNVCKAAVAGIEPATERLTAAHPYQHEHHRNGISLSPQGRKVGVAGFEPTISCSRRTRISKLSHTPITRRRRLLPQRSPTALKSTRRESNPHVRPGEAAGRRYITGALGTESDCQRTKSTG